MLPLTSMGKKDISSSDGENGAKAIDKGASISVVPSSSRKLPSWAGTSHFNLKSKSSGTSQMQSMQTKFTSNSTKNVRKSKDSAKIFELEDQSRTREHLCFENTDRSSSVNIPGNRRLPYSLMKDESAKEMSGSEFGKNIQHIQGRECKMSGIERLEVHLQTQPGVGSHFDNHELHKDGKEDFQVCGDLLSVPGQEPSSQQMLQRNLQPSIDPSLSRSNSKASIETKDVVLDKHRSHTNANSKAYMETTCLVPDKHGLSHSQLDGENVQSNSPPSTWHTTRTYSISTQPSLSVSVSKPSKKTGGISMDDQLAEDPVLEVDRKSSSQQMLRRVLPPSLQPAVSKSQSRAFKQAEVYGKQKDGVTIHEDVSTRRLLPPSLMQRGSVNHPGSAGLSNTSSQAGTAEEGPIENNEQLVFQAALQDLEQPKLEARVPEGVLSVPLLRHQRIALAWMLQKESESSHCLGGILADDQGLGKTVSAIALIQMQRPLQSKSISDGLSQAETEALGLVDGCHTCEPGKMKKEKHEDLKHSSPCKGNLAAGTLVVCPASVLRQWAQELDEKVPDDSKLSVLLYHGSNRTDDPFELVKYDVVLTTYSIVSNEVPKLPFVANDDGEQIDRDEYPTKKRNRTSNVLRKRKKSKKGISAFRCHGGPLAMVCWFRVVLDEAQTIKNYRSQVARACYGLKAKRRWCLSGTPIQNAIDDLYSYFRFLKYDPYSVYTSFCSSIKLPISRDEMSGYKKLQAVLKTIMLRRTKGTLIDGEPIIQLPPKTICLKRVNFTVEERNFYSKLETDSRLRFKEYAAAGTVSQNYANILLLLLRLRQACDHPNLVKGYKQDYVEKTSLEKARKLPRKTQKNLLNLLQASLTLCGICNDQPEDAVVTVCGHVFCYQCLSEHLIGDDNVCPAADCDEQLADDAVFSRATLQSCFSDELDNCTTSEVAEKFTAGEPIMCSSKIRAAMEILQSVSKNSSSAVNGCKDIASFPERNGEPVLEKSYSSSNAKIDTLSNSTIQSEPPNKAIVFSQWTSMLDLLEISLIQSSIEYRRLDGTMSLASRDRAVKDFSSDPEVTVMIMSLKAGNLGLNMVAACHIILLDPWWNPTTEDQAIDRAHRIGQTRPVMVSRLTVKDTVEDRILSLQEKKRKIVSSAFGEDQSGRSATRLTVEDLRYLFMV